MHCKCRLGRFLGCPSLSMSLRSAATAHICTPFTRLVPDLFQTCDFDCHSLVDLQIDLRLRLIGLAKWRPRATTCSKESKSKITSACAMIRFDSAVSTHQGVITPVLVCVVWLVWVVWVSGCKWIHSGYPLVN